MNPLSALLPRDSAWHAGARCAQAQSDVFGGLLIPSVRRKRRRTSGAGRATCWVACLSLPFAAKGGELQGQDAQHVGWPAYPFRSPQKAANFRGRTRNMLGGLLIPSVRRKRRRTSGAGRATYWVACLSLPFAVKGGELQGQDAQHVGWPAYPFRSPQKAANFRGRTPGEENGTHDRWRGDRRWAAAARDRHGVRAARRAGLRLVRRAARATRTASG